MATTKDDIEKGGGKCEKAGDGFWTCTDKDGKEWWCDAEQWSPRRGLGHTLEV